MSTSPSDLQGAAGPRLIAGYLERLERAAAGLPDGARAELIADIRAHLSDTAGDAPDEATARRVLEELGEPEEIAAAAAPEPGPRPDRTGAELAYDVGTVLVLLLGGFIVPFAGWIAGVVMLWNGPRWDLRHKWTGTLLWPAAIVAGLAALMIAHAGGRSLGLVLAGVVIILGGLTFGFTYLLRASRKAGAPRPV